MRAVTPSKPRGPFAWLSGCGCPGFHVGLHVRFTDKAALDVYGPHPEHTHVVDSYLKPILLDHLVGASNVCPARMLSAKRNAVSCAAFALYKRPACVPFSMHVGCTHSCCVS